LLFLFQPLAPRSSTQPHRGRALITREPTGRLLLGTCLVCLVLQTYDAASKLHATATTRRGQPTQSTPSLPSNCRKLLNTLFQSLCVDRTASGFGATLLFSKQTNAYDSHALNANAATVNAGQSLTHSAQIANGTQLALIITAL
jgi:hypothetical protein